MSNKTDLQTLNAEYALLIDEVKNNVIGHSHDDRYYTEEEIDEKLSNAGIPIVVASSTDGVTYTANLENAVGLNAGMKITIIPNMTSTSKIVSLDLNGFGVKQVCMPVNSDSASVAEGPIEGWIVMNKPLTIEYDGETYWKTISMPKAGIDRESLFAYGTEDLEAGVSELEEGKLYFVYE